MFAKVFLTADEQAIGAVLYQRRRGTPIAAQRFDSFNKLDTFKEAFRSWLTDQSAADLFSEVEPDVEEAFELFEAYKQHGPDVCLDWPGSRNSRRLPTIY